MTAVQIAPLGGTCSLKSAVVGPSGTATACPDPTTWMLNEMALAESDTANGGWIYPAIFHQRSAPLDCWSRAQNAGIVQ